MQKSKQEIFLRAPVNELTNDPIVLRIMDQLQLQGKTEKSLLQFLDIPSTTFTSWKYRNVKSYMKHIDEIAEFLEVDKDYLLEGTDRSINMDTLTATEIKLIGQFRDMGNRQQILLMGICDTMVESTNFERMTEK